MEKIILATASKHRIEGFKHLGLEFLSEKSNIEEHIDGRPDDPEELVKCLSRLKAEAVKKNHPDGIVMGFDSVGYFEGQILEKPQSREEAFDRLSKLSGKDHEFITGVHMINIKNRTQLQRVVSTHITFRDLLEESIDRYLNDSEDYRTRALGYSPFTGISSTFPRLITGNFSNLAYGIPLDNVIEMYERLIIKK